jgi:hypothetical protein
LGQRDDIEPGENPLGLVETTDQQVPPRFEIAGGRGVRPIAMRFERSPRRAECLDGPTQIAQNERNLSFGDDASCTGCRLVRTKGTGRTSQQLLRPRKIAELRHRDATQRKRWCIVTQCDALQCRQRISRCKCPCRSRDQRVHRNPVTFVTPTRLSPRLTSVLDPGSAGDGDNRLGTGK